MAGITTRSVASLHLEAIKNLFESDSNIMEDFAGGVRLGPLVPSPDSGDATVTPRQINLLIAPNIFFEPGTSGVNTIIIPVIVAMYDFYTEAPYQSGAPNVTPWDRREYLEAKLANGSELDGSGKLVNPDDPTNVNTVIKYLNVTTPEFRTIAMGTPLKGNVARLYAFVAAYETRIHNVTRQRK